MILVDTGAWLALADKGDAYHARCVAFFRSNREPLMTTYPVLVECVHLMLRRIGVTKTLAWMETLAAQGVGVFAMGVEHLPRLTELMRHSMRICRWTWQMLRWFCWPKSWAKAGLSAPMGAIFMRTVGRVSTRLATCCWLRVDR